MMVLSFTIVINVDNSQDQFKILIMMLKDKLIEIPILKIGIYGSSTYTNFNITARE